VLEIIFYLLLGVIAGVLAGLFGVGGGIVFVPALLIGFEWLDVPESVLTHLTVGTSLACVVFTASSSIIAHHRRQGVIWKSVKEMSGFLLLGAILGAWTADQLSGFVLRLILGSFLLVMAIKMLFEKTSQVETAKESNPALVVTGLMGLLTGWISSMLGIAGGALTVPFLKAYGAPIKKAIGTASALGLPIAVAGSVTHILVAGDNQYLPRWSLGYVYLPAFFGIVATSAYFAKWGARLAHHLDQVVLQRLFGLLLGFLAIRMIWITLF
jgi:uncharacterized membrane protein YfcA